MSNEKKPWWKNQRTVKWLSVATLVIVFLGFLRWFTLPTPRYFWPKAAEDWSAWGQCVGAVGTILAVVYAARTLKSTSVAQYKEQRDRRLEMDFLEAKEADEALKLRPSTKGFARYRDEWAESDDASGARILVQNFSENPFHEVQIFVPDDSFEEGLPLSKVQFWEADLVENEDNLGWSPGRWAASESGVLLPGTNLFTLGTVHPRKCRSVSFDFSGYEQMMRWNHRSSDAVDGFGREMLVNITFVDRNGKAWQRTSRDRGKIMRLRREVTTSASGE
jgi:hypothetical protein